MAANQGVGTRRRVNAGRPLAVPVGRDRAGPETDGLIAALAASGRAGETSAHGSSLKVCRMAEGAADLYPRLGPTAEGGTAAPQPTSRPPAVG